LSYERREENAAEVGSLADTRSILPVAAYFSGLPLFEYPSVAIHAPLNPQNSIVIHLKK
jgi:hypothetical protein